MPLFELAETIGILSFALSGLLISYKERLDILGLFIIMFLTALGGGVMRDILVDRPPYALTHMLPVTLVILVMIAGLFFKVHRKESIERAFWYILSDTLGLVSFAISGALLAYRSELTIFGVMLVALITAIGGGTLRDMMLNKIPFFLRTEFYGSVVLLIGTLVYGLGVWGWLNQWSLIVLFIAATTLRLLAYYRQWHLPKI
jgi:uncharacterized membrane protein YeiH